ncbi:MAG TPA: hypothetical protein VG753_02065 [Candidatus Paceibacterota bacterium]|nr:hypothetical protein [Candidatus Paceibacterota bacterium]
MEPFIRRLAKYNKTEFRAEYSFYKGRMTKRAVREEKLRRRVELAAPFAIMQLDKMAQDGEETEEKKVRGRSF